MADEKIKDLPLFNSGTDANDKNIYVVSVWESGDEGSAGVYISKRIREEELIQLIPLKNIATNNLLFTANSNTDFAGFTATFDNAELKIIADANTSGDKPFQVTKADGTTVIFDVRGNGQIGFNGVIDPDYIATFKGSTLSGNAYFTRTAAGINVNFDGGGASTYSISQNHTVAQYFGEGAATIGVWGSSTTGTGVKAETTGAGLALEVIGKVKTISPSASPLDIAFTVRNNTDTSGLVNIQANGSSEWLQGYHSFGDSINTGAKLQGVTNTGGVVAVRGYHYGSGGMASFFAADGANAQAVKATAIGSGASAIKATGFYALDFDGKIIDTPQATTPVMPQTNAAGEAALVATLTIGQWYYLDSGVGGIGTVKVKLS